MNYATFSGYCFWVSFHNQTQQKVLMGEILKFDWNDEVELKANLENWAYNDDLILLEQDEDLLFHDIEWTEVVLPFIFDKKCIKREYILNNFLGYIREVFLYRKTKEIEQIQKLFIDDMTTHYSISGDSLIGNGIDYYFSCKRIFYHPLEPNIEQAKHIAKLLLNGLTNTSKINEPTISTSGNYQITSTSSVVCHLCIDKVTGHYKYNGYKPCE